MKETIINQLEKIANESDFDTKDVIDFIEETDEDLESVKKEKDEADDRIEELESENKKLNIAGLSNSCFYEKQFDYNGDDVSISLTTDCAKYLSQVIDADSELSINYNKTFFCVYFEGMSIVSTQLASNPPAYQKILEVIQKTSTLKIDRELFLSCVKRFSAISDKDSKSFMLDISEGKMSISYKNNLLNHKANEEVKEFEYVGDEISIGLNINKLKTILTTLEEDEVVVYLSYFNKPMLFVEENTRILISPMIADKI